MVMVMELAGTVALQVAVLGLVLGAAAALLVGLSTLAGVDTHHDVGISQPSRRTCLCFWLPPLHT